MTGEWVAILPALEAEGGTPEEAAERLATLAAEPLAMERIIVVEASDAKVFEVGVYQVPG